MKRGNFKHNDEDLLYHKEIFIKAKINYEMFKQYYSQDKGEFSIHNGFKFANGKYLISGLGLFNLFHDYKLKFTREENENENYFLLKFENQNEIEDLIEFYIPSEEGGNITTLIGENAGRIQIQKFTKVKLDCVLIVKKILHFYDKFSTYFSEVDNYFPINEPINRMACSSFLILTDANEVPGNNFAKVNENFNIGEEVITLSSSLGVISYPHFSKSFSKGVIGNLLMDDILLLDLRVLPNSHGTIVYVNAFDNTEKSTMFNKNKLLPVAIVLPILNVKYSYTPIIFAFRLNKMMEILKSIFYNKRGLKLRSTKIYNSIISIPPSLPGPISNVTESAFIIFNSKHYASCFYIGHSLFMTNKHFFTDYELNDEIIYVKNPKTKNTLKCRKVFIPNNNMDLAIVRAENRNTTQNTNLNLTNKIPPVKITKDPITLLQPVYCVSYSYFDKREIINELSYPNIFKGCISNKITLSHFDMVYQIDTACFSGGSGGPVVNFSGELVGVIFQNLQFQTGQSLMQVPNSGFIISKEIVRVTIEEIEKHLNLNNFNKSHLDFSSMTSINLNFLHDLWCYKMSNELIDELFNFNKFKPNF